MLPASTPLYFVMAEYIAKGDNRFRSLPEFISLKKIKQSVYRKKISMV
jgi:hypothetical protein